MVRRESKGKKRIEGLKLNVRSVGSAGPLGI